jgi:MFS family permease
MGKRILKLYFFTFFSNLHFFSAVLIPFFTDWGGISKFQALLLQSWFMFWIFVLEIPTGVVADYFGRKYSLALGALAVTFGALIYGSIPSFPVFLLGEFLFAAAFAFMSGADDAFLFDSLKEEGKESEIQSMTGKIHAIQLLAMLIAAPLGGLFASKLGINAPMYLCTIPFFIASIIAMTMKEPKVFDKTRESRRYLDIAKQGIRFFYQNKKLRLLAFDAILVSIAAYYVIWLYQPLLQKIAMPIAFFGIYHFFLVGSEIVIALNFSRLEKIAKSAKNYMRFTAIITALMFFVVLLATNKITILLFVIIAGGFGLTRLELMTAYMNKIIPSVQRATILSSISMFRRFSLALFNPFIGYLSDRSLSITLLVVGVIPLLVFFFSPIEKEMFE